MIRIGLRDARSHFGRFIMSIVAIALGVSFVVGSFCFREMLNNQVSQMMSTNADHDVYVRGSQEKKKDSSAMSMGSTKSYNDVDVDLAGTIAKVDGVSSARVVHMLSGVVLLDKHGDAVTTMGLRRASQRVGKSSPWRSAKFTTGTWPKNGDEIALHSFAAEQSGLKVGDKTKIVYPDGAHKVTVSGIFTTDASQAGAIIIAIDPVTAKEKASKQSDDPDKTSLISVYGNKTTPLDDNAQQQLADRINKALPRSAKAHAITGDEYRDESTKSTQDALGFIQPLILIFAVIALFVGSFIIANTFSMIVRESMRGYALLRSIGASPASVLHGDRASSVAGPGRFARRHRARLGHGQTHRIRFGEYGYAIDRRHQSDRFRHARRPCGRHCGDVDRCGPAGAKCGACPADSGDERNRQSGKARPRTWHPRHRHGAVGLPELGFHLRFGRRGW